MEEQQQRQSLSDVVAEECARLLERYGEVIDEVGDMDLDAAQERIETIMGAQIAASLKRIVGHEQEHRLQLAQIGRELRSALGVDALVSFESLEAVGAGRSGVGGEPADWRARLALLVKNEISEVLQALTQETLMQEVGGGRAERIVEVVRARAALASDRVVWHYAGIVEKLGSAARDHQNELAQIAGALNPVPPCDKTTDVVESFEGIMQACRAWRRAYARLEKLVDPTPKALRTAHQRTALASVKRELATVKALALATKRVNDENERLRAEVAIRRQMSETLLAPDIGTQSTTVFVAHVGEELSREEYTNFVTEILEGCEMKVARETHPQDTCACVWCVRAINVVMELAIASSENGGRA